MNSAQANAEIWEGLYASGNEGMAYPSEVLVRISHHLLHTATHPNLLAFGFGGGAEILHFTKRGFRVAGVEVSKSALAVVSRRLERAGEQADLRLIEKGVIPFGNGEFDVVVAWQVLYYNDWDTLGAAVKEIDRVIRPGGVFLGTMAAVGDISSRTGTSLGDSLYESTVPGQAGARTLVLERVQLSRCFPNRELTIGEFGIEFLNTQSRHWIVSYTR